MISTKTASDRVPDGCLYATNTGVDGRILFSSQEDFDRFEAYLYLFNSAESPRVSNIFKSDSQKNIFEIGRGELLVHIAGFCFTPKEFHIVLAPAVPGGVGKFMQKLQTGYTMYFNKKYNRSGRLFHSAYRSTPIDGLDALKFFCAHTHLSAAALFDLEWFSDVRELDQHARKALTYRYSSIGEYTGNDFKISSPQVYPKQIRTLKNVSSLVSVWKKQYVNYFD